MITIQRIAVSVLVAAGIWGTTLWIYDLKNAENEAKTTQATGIFKTGKENVKWTVLVMQHHKLAPLAA